MDNNNNKVSFFLYAPHNPPGGLSAEGFEAFRKSQNRDQRKRKVVMPFRMLKQEEIHFQKQSNRGAKFP